jgi:transposase-like protein
MKIFRQTLSEFSDAINSIFPKTIVQSCIAHQNRNPLKHLASKSQKKFLKDLRQAYQTVNREKAENELDNLELKWGGTYPITIKSWRDNRHKLSAYFQYSDGIRKMIYTAIQ